MLEWIAVLVVLTAAWLLSRARPAAALYASLLALPSGLFILAEAGAVIEEDYSGIAVLNKVAWDHLLGHLVPALLLILGPPTIWLLTLRARTGG